MDVRVVALREAAALLGRTPQGLRARRQRGTLLCDGSGAEPTVLVVNGTLVETLDVAAGHLTGMAEALADRTRENVDLQARLAAAEERVATLADQLHLAQHELELERHRTATDLRTMAQAVEATARVISERMGRS